MLNKINKGYNGNVNLKKLGQTIPYTENIVEQYKKCMDDPVYFIKNYCKIINLDKGLTNFDLFECQERMINTYHNNRKTIVMIGRQSGKTQTSAAYILWYVLFNSDKSAAILANKAFAAREVLSRIQLMYEYLPPWLQQGVKTWNKGDIELENNSKIFTQATSGNACRGKSISLLYVDEAAFIPNNIAEEFFTSVYPTISSGKETKIILSSTPSGYNHFWKFWTEAENNTSDFKHLYIHYSEIPGRNEAWANEQKRLLGEVKFAQEILCSFLGSSYTLLSGNAIAKVSSMVTCPIFQNENGTLNVYEEPKDGRSYVIVVDTARGRHLDYSAFIVVDITDLPYKVVAKFRDNEISPLLYPNVILHMANRYKNAYVLIEINDLGQQVADSLFYDQEYEFMYFTKNGKVFENANTEYPGVRTTKSVKAVGCETLKSLIENDKLLINDVDAAQELSVFIQKKNSYAADDGYHDDLVMCLVLFAWLTMQPHFKDLMNVNIRHNLYKSQMEQIEESLTPFGFYSTGKPIEDTAKLSEDQKWKATVKPEDKWMFEEKTGEELYAEFQESLRYL